MVALPPKEDLAEIAVGLQLRFGEDDGQQGAEARPREIWDGLRISKQGAMDLIRPLVKAKLVKRVGTLKNGRYVLR